MGVIKKEMLTEDQFVLLLWHFNEYKVSLNAVGQREINKYNFIERKRFLKLRDNVNKFWEELDSLN